MSKDTKQENKEKSTKNEKKTKSDEYLDPETKKFKKGNPGGPGRPKGVRDWSTDFNEAIKVVAKQTGKTQSEIRTELIIRGIAEARKGNFNFWKEITDRNYGKMINMFGIDSDTIDSVEIITKNKDEASTGRGQKHNDSISKESKGMAEEKT